MRKRATNPHILFRPWITLPDGRRIFAKDFGKKAFVIRLR